MNTSILILKREMTGLLRKLHRSAHRGGTKQGLLIYAGFADVLEECSTVYSLKKTTNSIYSNLASFQRFADLNREEWLILVEFFSIAEKVLSLEEAESKPPETQQDSVPCRLV